jgi:hypothetical protein
MLTLNKRETEKYVNNIEIRQSQKADFTSGFFTVILLLYPSESTICKISHCTIFAYFHNGPLKEANELSRIIF